MFWLFIYFAILTCLKRSVIWRSSVLEASSSLTSEYVSLIMARNMFCSMDKIQVGLEKDVLVICLNWLCWRLKDLPVTQRRQRTHKWKNILVPGFCLLCRWRRSQSLQGWSETGWNCSRELEIYVLLYNFKICTDYYYCCMNCGKKVLTCIFEMCWKIQPEYQTKDSPAGHRRKTQWRTWPQTPGCPWHSVPVWRTAVSLSYWN